MENNECLNCKAYTKCLLAALRGEQIKCIHFLHIMDDLTLTVVLREQREKGSESSVEKRQNQRKSDKI